MDQSRVPVSAEPGLHRVQDLMKHCVGDFFSVSSRRLSLISSNIKNLLSLVPMRKQIIIIKYHFEFAKFEIIYPWGCRTKLKRTKQQEMTGSGTGSCTRSGTGSGTGSSTGCSS